MKHTKNALIIVFLFIGLSLFSQSKEGYSLVWEDNFNGTSLDTSAWSHETAEPGWVNNELQRYTTGNIEFAEGNLVIISKKENGEYTSARLITKGKRTFTYGLFEIKAKIPEGTGTWPALWMLGQNIDQVGWPACGELDIMEHVGKHPNFIHSTVHNPSGYGATPYTGIIEINDPFNTYHIYSMEWTKEYVDFYTDGKLVYHYQPEVKNAENWPFDKPCYFIFNIAIGGNWGGPVVDDTLFPATMTVDWIKAYQK
ncbi:MAG: glycoside hydrolase family 16 protein [Bacteroidales bacterium]|nr:glycoside hydrolase family 16 protein [Bacteroidales bacterium]